VRGRRPLLGVKAPRRRKGSVVTERDALLSDLGDPSNCGDRKRHGTRLLSY